MASQSKTFHKEVIRDAMRDGSLHTLYWFIEMTLPIKYGGTKSAATYRNGVPVIPVAPDVAGSHEAAELLRWQFEDSNRGRGISFNVALTSTQALKVVNNWYEWGDRNEPDTLDNICPECGQVHVTTYDQSWACCGWSQLVVAKETSVNIPTTERWTPMSMAKYRVDATSLEDFMSRYYKPDRYTGRGEEYAVGLLASYREELNRDGIAWICYHDSVTGEHVSYVPQSKETKTYEK